MIFIKQVCSLQPMIIKSPRNKMLATRLDCLIGPELSKPYRAGLALTESCSCSVRRFPSLTELRSRSVRPSRAGPLLGKVWLVPKPEGGGYDQVHPAAHAEGQRLDGSG